jgi:hypothetical protein
MQTQILPRDIWAIIVTSLWTGGPENCDSIPSMGNKFLFSIQAPEVTQFHSSSYPVDTGGFFFPGIKLPEREGDHSPSSSAVVQIT